MNNIALDIRTLSYVTVLFAFGLGAGLISFALVQRSFGGLIRVGVGFTCIGLGFMLIGLRGILPNALSVVAANTILLAGFAFINNGIRKLLVVKRSNIIGCLTIIIANTALFTYYTYLDPDISRRVFWISVFLAVISAMSCKSILHEAPDHSKAPQWLIALGFALFAGFMLFRGIWALEDIPILNFMSAGNIHGLAFLAVILLLLIVSFGLLWMANVYLQDELKLFERIISATPDIILLADRDGVYSMVNDTGLKQLGMSREDVLGKSSSELFGNEFYDAVTKPNLDKVFQGEIKYTSTWLDIPTDGRRYVTITYHPVSDSNGRINFAAITIKDISDLRLAQEERQLIFELSLDMLAIAGMDGYFKELNPAWTRTLGWSREELMATAYVDFVHPDDVQATIDIGTQLMEGEPVVDFVNRYRTKDGSYKYISWASHPDIPSRRIFAVAKDVSDRIRMEEELKKLAAIDPLTGADNRRSFLQRLHDEISRSRRYETPLSLIMLDIDHFKNINDSFGHIAGDDALKGLAATCREALRSTDILGRLGGEEFAVVLPHTGADAAFDTADRLRVRLGQSIFNTESGPVNFTVSAGVTELRPDEESIEKLIMRADQALYRAKNNGRNRVEIER